MSEPALPQRVRSILRCPTCRSTVTFDGGSVACDGCAVEFPISVGVSGSTLDLRPSHAFEATVPVMVGRGGPDPSEHDLGVFRPNPTPGVDWTGVDPPHHVSRALMSWVPAATGPDSVALDLGCGSTLHRHVLQHAGHTYVGVDYGNPSAPIKADAHALPFEDDSFDVVFTVAVFEHLHNPLRAMQEVTRVLKPRGRVVGTVAFLEPFHDRSYFLHSHLGVLDTLIQARLFPVFVAPMKDWTVLDAQPKALFPRMPRPLQRLVTAPLQILHHLWWSALRLRRRSYFTDARRLAATTGAFAFVADAGTRPASRDEDAFPGKGAPEANC